MENKTWQKHHGANLRLQYADIQTKIDEANSVEELESLVKSLKFY